jgi:hypothetical protein
MRKFIARKGRKPVLPGAHVEASAHPGSEGAGDAYLRALEDVSRRRPVKEMTTDEIMAMTRGDDWRS